MSAKPESGFMPLQTEPHPEEMIGIRDQIRPALKRGIAKLGKGECGECARN